jgi:hypothetical protein
MPVNRGIILHEKRAPFERNCTALIRYRSEKQLSLAEFTWPLHPALDENINIA